MDPKHQGLYSFFFKNSCYYYYCYQSHYYHKDQFINKFTALGSYSNINYPVSNNFANNLMAQHIIFQNLNFFSFHQEHDET